MNALPIPIGPEVCSGAADTKGTTHVVLVMLGEERNGLMVEVSSPVRAQGEAA
ncbi:MAG: hypothetical protein ACT4PZ_02220 [Panacagrimonas sp.]